MNHKIKSYLSKASAKFVAPITMTPSFGLNLERKTEIRMDIITYII